MKTFKATVTFVDSDRIWSELIATKSQAVAIRAARRLAMQAAQHVA